MVVGVVEDAMVVLEIVLLFDGVVVISFCGGCSYSGGWW